MPALSGKQKKIGIATGSTFGTAVAATNLIPVDNFTMSKGSSRLEDNPAGINYAMLEDVDFGNINPSASIAMKLGYNNHWPFFAAQMFGTSPAPTEQTVGQGDYLHVMTLNITTLNAKYLTLAELSTSTLVREYPSAVVTDLVVNFNAPRSYVTSDISMLGNNLVLNSSTNTNAAGVGVGTIGTLNQAILELADSFLINAQAGAALSSPTDKVNITGLTVTYSKPQRTIPEAKGSVGNSDFVADGNFSCLLAVSFKQLDDFTWFNAQAAGTEYKAKIIVDGAQIGTGLNNSLTLFFPRLKIVEDPEHNITGPGIDPQTVVFEALQATASPSGMSSVYPYLELVNTRSTTYL